MIDWPAQLPVINEGELALRPWVTGDEQRVFEICQDPDVAEWTTIPLPYTFEHAKSYVANRTHDYDAHQAISYVGIVDDKVAIAVSLHHINEFDHWAEIGYWTAPEVRGRGLTARAVKLITEFAFSIGFRRVQAIADPGNASSQGVLRKAGYIQEAILQNGITRRDGTQVQALMFAALPAK